MSERLNRQQAGKPARFVGRHEVIGPPACPIMHRWTLLKVGGRKLMLHHFLPNADDRAEHDHPASFWTFVLRGGYDDFVPCPICGGDGSGCRSGSTPATGSPCGRTGMVAGDRMRAGMRRRRAATYRHRTRVLPSGAWTLVWMGRKERPWGFWVDGRWWPWADHEKAFGFGMRCPTEREDEGR